ncbi:putative ring finger domain-containing protein [Erysiphe neolycopersici]|uniref:Putative ring finger domain-containing protein n=1 Tax=Erysiphe neolycopersici TaxID=212602 RepID=A0A420HUM1_9PEZI|nr:putative ring finger domain-containing protein [Erysiphe neolycopersici]
MISATQKLNGPPPNGKLNEIGTCILYARSLREPQRCKYRRVMGAENRGLDLERELTCTICTEILYAPQTLLDCLHTFCGSCLKKWFSWQYSSWRNTSQSIPSAVTPFTCPACRAPVRDTKHNSTVTTLLEMFLTANPDKCRRAEELEELKKIYSRGDCVLPKVVTRDKVSSSRRGRAVNSDRSLVDEVRELSLREALTENHSTRRELNRRGNEDSRRPSPSSVRHTTSEVRTIDERIHVRRRRREQHISRQNREEASQVNEALRGRRRNRSDDERLSQQENHDHQAVRQVDHQSSLRSLISQNEFDSLEMEEEILRQIREEGLLDGIDLENIDVNQEEQISESIAEAFRRRQNERARQHSNRRNTVTEIRIRNESSSESSESSRRISSRASPRNSSNLVIKKTGSVRVDLQILPPSSSRALQSARSRSESIDEKGQSDLDSRKDNRFVAQPLPSTNLPVRPATRSASDLRDRSHSMLSPITWTKVAHASRSSIDLSALRPTDESMPNIRPLRIRSNSNSQSGSTQNQGNFPSTSEQSRHKTSEISSSISLPKKPCISPSCDKGLVPAPLTSNQKLSERANVLSTGPRLNSSTSKTGWKRSSFYTEPLIKCARCGKVHIEYEWHFNCKICSEGNYNICLSCYRAGRGCQYWLGIGESAWKKWEALDQTSSTCIEKPHILTPSRYLPPKIIPGGADGRRTLTTEDPRKRLQSGTFCANCYVWTNECYWRCNICNDGDWGFCNNCVNQGYCCTHSLLPLSYNLTEDNANQSSPTHGNKRPDTAHILTGPFSVDSGPFKPLTFSTRCDICRYPIQPSQTRYHCFSCTSSTSNKHIGNYDVCINCYPKLVRSRHISKENGPSGWRRCLKGHRMVIIGFQDKYDGQYRYIVNDMVGGRSLQQKPCTIPELIDREGLQIWSWGDGLHIRGDNSHAKLVTIDVQKSAKSSSGSYSLVEKIAATDSFPSDGGVGMIAVAIWAWFPSTNNSDKNDNDDNELFFPRGAEIRECKDVNGDWFHGTYMGRQGLFPANHVRILEKDKSGVGSCFLSSSSSSGSS